LKQVANAFCKNVLKYGGCMPAAQQFGAEKSAASTSTPSKTAPNDGQLLLLRLWLISNKAMGLRNVLINGST
jgi:hypothetical protein